MLRQNQNLQLKAENFIDMINQRCLLWLNKIGLFRLWRYIWKTSGDNEISCVQEGPNFVARAAVLTHPLRVKQMNRGRFMAATR